MAQHPLPHSLPGFRDCYPEQLAERVMREAARLRGAGHSVEFALRPQTPPKQLKAAKSAGAHEIVTLD